jgi:hypothetical protein
MDQKAKQYVEALQLAVSNGSREECISVYDQVEHDQAFTWEEVSEALFIQWDALVDKANDLINA